MPHTILVKPSTIALIDWNWVGHHPTYYTHFALALSKAGCRVVPFCANPHDFLDRLAGANGSKEIKDLITEPVHIAGPKPSKFRPARWKKHFEALRAFWELAKAIRHWQKKHSQIDLIFYACIYDSNFLPFRFVERFLRLPWSGLYLHARSFRMPGSPIPHNNMLPCPEKFLSSFSIKSICILDEGVRNQVSEMTGKKPVYIFPDITEENLPIKFREFGLGAKIRRCAGDRPVVSLIGYLQWTKGIDIFTDVAILPEMQQFFFFLGGEVNWTQTRISHDSMKKMLKAWEDSVNIFAHQHHLSEAAMNSVIASSDVIVAAYREFPNSSNVLTKAAVFERPIIVSDGYVMAERVRQYSLGEIIPEGDVQALACAIQKMAHPGYIKQLRLKARWAEYRQAHSIERLNEVFRELVATL